MATSHAAVRIENIFRLGPWQLRVIHNGQWLEQADFVMPVMPSASQTSTTECLQGPRSSLTQAIETYLNDYLGHRQPAEALPLANHGSVFRQRVWAALRAIPAGSQMTYGQLARTLNSAAQPIGGACRHNPIVFFTPCHRIVAANGLGGFMGQSQASAQLQCKAWLLQHERGFHVQHERGFHDA